MIKNLDSRRKYALETKQIMNDLYSQKLSMIRDVVTNYGSKLELDGEDQVRMLNMSSTKAIVTYVKRKMHSQKVERATKIL